MFGVPREKIPWFPTIDYEKCIGCKECFNFCKNGVFEWNDDEDTPNVVRPFNCVVGCSACANLCDQEAVSFPKMQDIKRALESQ